jgi:hypothetical protein
MESRASSVSAWVELARIFDCGLDFAGTELHLLIRKTPASAGIDTLIGLA